jgi:hypothetical protein
MYPDVGSEKSGYAATPNEKGLALPTVNTDTSPSSQPDSTLSRVLGHRPNHRQKRLLAFGAAYITAFLTFKAWSVSRHDGSALPFDNSFGHNSYLDGLMGHGWSFASMQDRIDQPSVEDGGSFFSQMMDYDKQHRGDHHGHGHRHLKPPFRHVTPQQAEEIFFKVPNNDSAAA